MIVGVMMGAIAGFFESWLRRSSPRSSRLRLYLRKISICRRFRRTLEDEPRKAPTACKACADG